jgi:hypothetical protein
MNAPVVGIIEYGPGSGLGLARAARQLAGIACRSVSTDEAPNADVAGLILEGPLAGRGDLLARLAPLWGVPILVESPVAESAEQAGSIAELTGDSVVACNPLCYGLHTRRLIEELRTAEDPLETLFAAWRFRPDSATPESLPQLLGYLSELCSADVMRVSAMVRATPRVLTVSMRFATGALGSLELGAHLPRAFPAPSELVMECFCRSRVFHCTPGEQAITVYGPTHTHLDWQPTAGETIVRAFAAWLGGAPRPAGGALQDAAALRLAERIEHSARTGSVLEIVRSHAGRDV